MNEQEQEQEQDFEDFLYGGGGLPVRALNVIQNIGFTKVEDLCKSEALWELVKAPRCGVGTIRAVLQRIEDQNRPVLWKDEFENTTPARLWRKCLRRDSAELQSAHQKRLADAELRSLRWLLASLLVCEKAEDGDKKALKRLEKALRAATRARQQFKAGHNG